MFRAGTASEKLNELAEFGTTNKRQFHYERGPWKGKVKPKPSNSWQERAEAEMGGTLTGLVWYDDMGMGMDTMGGEE
jgi:hypothetical protein